MDYHDPLIAEIYDVLNPPARDADFYLSLAGPSPSTVLDLGCGTGVLCCALAQQGHRVTGLDPAAAMLATARRKPYADRVEWVESSAQNYRSSRRFDLIIMMGHAFQVLLSDAETLAVFGTMRQHLNQGGRIAFETRNPQLNWALQWESRPPATHTLRGQPFVETLQITAADGEFISFQTSYRFPHNILTTSSTLRFPSLAHVESLLTRSGLVVCDIFGDWDAGSFDPQRSPEIILVAHSTPE